MSDAGAQRTSVIERPERIDRARGPGRRRGTRRPGAHRVIAERDLRQDQRGQRGVESGSSAPALNQSITTGPRAVISTFSGCRSRCRMLLPAGAPGHGGSSCRRRSRSARMAGALVEPSSPVGAGLRQRRARRAVPAPCHDPTPRRPRAPESPGRRHSASLRPRRSRPAHAGSGAAPAARRARRRRPPGRRRAADRSSAEAISRPRCWSVARRRRRASIAPVVASPVVVGRRPGRAGRALKLFGPALPPVVVITPPPAGGGPPFTSCSGSVPAAIVLDRPAVVVALLGAVGGRHVLDAGAVIAVVSHGLAGCPSGAAANRAVVSAAPSGAARPSGAAANRAVISSAPSGFAKR